MFNLKIDNKKHFWVTEVSQKLQSLNVRK